LKIAMFSWESLYSIRTGGLAQAVTDLAEALSRIGHQVHVFTRRGENQSEREEINKVIYHRCGFHPGGNILEYVENMCNSMVDRFYSVENDVNGFDVLHGHDWHVINTLDKIKSARGYPFILSYHSTEFGRNGGAFGDWWEFREISGREWYGGLISDIVVTVSRTMKNELRRLYEIPEWKIKVIPNGINTANYELEIDPGRIKEKYGIHPLAPTILFVGRMVTQKGPDLLVEAIPTVLNHRWDARFIFVGDGDMRGYLEDRCSVMGVSHAVRFLGYLPDEMYKEVLNASDIVCIPSRNEPFGLVLLEAWSAKKAVVATDVGGLSENIENFMNGIKVYLEPSSIAWGINYIINDAEGVRKLGMEGYKTAREFFSWGRIAERTLEVYTTQMTKR